MSRLCSKVDLDITPGQSRYPWPLRPQEMGTSQDWCLRPVPARFTVTGLDGGTESYPDAASRFQPHGPHGPSQVIDPGAFQWHDQDWRGVSLEGQVLYEMHVGTFTPAGTWETAMGELPALAELGVTVLEIMPIADFSGRFGWGYDGVNLFAPTRLYGTPDDCRRFIDRRIHWGWA